MIAADGSICCVSLEHALLSDTWSVSPNHETARNEGALHKRQRKEPFGNVEESKGARNQN